MTLPAGFTVRVHGDVAAAGGGGVLVGGSPLRAIRLSPAARALVAGGEIRVNGDASAILADRLLDANIAVPVLCPGEVAAARDLTVVIPVRDRTGQLNRALSGLSPLSVIVVDDGSAGASAVSAVARAHGADVVRLERNVRSRCRP